MARFTRAELRRIIGEGCTDEMENGIIALHLGVVDPMKDDIERYKAESERLSGVQKELDALKATQASGDDYQKKYESEHEAFEAYKKDVEGQKLTAQKTDLVKAYFEGKGITGKNLGIAMRGASKEIDGITIANGQIKDTAELDALVAGDFAGLVVKTGEVGANTATPPANNGGNTFASMSLSDKMRYANEHPNEQSVKDWLENPTI